MRVSFLFLPFLFFILLFYGHLTQRTLKPGIFGYPLRDVQATKEETLAVAGMEHTKVSLVASGRLRKAP